MSSVVQRRAERGLSEVAESFYGRRRKSYEQFAADPLAPLEAGGVLVFDPDRGGPVEFKPWDHQVELIRAWITEDFLVNRGPLGNVHVDKSRQMGDTWALAYAVHYLLAYHDTPLLYQHQDLGEVCDSGPTIDSFFGKVKFIHDNWPREYGRPPLHFTGGTSPIIRHTASPQCFLTGEGQTADPGRGGRYLGGIIDEAARIAYAKQGQAALVRAIPNGRVYLSTPFGEANVFHEMKEERPAGMVFLSHHWLRHPNYSVGAHVAGEEPDVCERCQGVLAEVEYHSSSDATHRFPGKVTSPWYEKAVIGLTDEQVAQELDIDYAASLTARVYEEFNELRHVAPFVVPYEPSLPVELCFDYGNIPTAGCVCQELPNEYRVIADFEFNTGRPEVVAEEVRALLRELGMDERTLHFLPSMLAVGDPSGQAVQIATGRSLVADYAAQGISIVSKPTLSVIDTINSTKRILGGIPKQLVVSSRAERFVRHMKHNRWPVDRFGNRKTDAKQPENDEHNHMMRAFAYLIHWKWPAPPIDDALHAARRVYTDDDMIDPASRTGVLNPDIGYGTKL